MTEPKPTETPPAAPTPAPPADARPQYEFDDEQNRVIGDLALAIVWVRIPLLVTAVFQTVIAIGLAFRISRDGAHVVGVLGSVLTAVVCFVLASWLLRAAESFARITTTKGRDISHLMTALRNLGSWFDLLAFFVKLYLALLALILLILVLGSLTGSFRGPT